MDYKQAEISLSINMQGSLATRGRYGSFSNSNGTGLLYEQNPTFTKCKKSIHLGTAFVKGALEEAPKHLNMKPHIWRKLSEARRINIHIASYVRATHPEHRGYEAEIL